MGLYVVTVRLTKNPVHNPRSKVTGTCPLSPSCTDATGEHHSTVFRAFDLETAWFNARQQWSHVTRVEEVPEIG